MEGVNKKLKVSSCSSKGKDKAGSGLHTRGTAGGVDPEDDITLFELALRSRPQSMRRHIEEMSRKSTRPSSPLQDEDTKKRFTELMLATLDQKTANKHGQ